MEDENDLALALNVAVGMAVYLMIEARTFAARLLLAATAVLLLAANVATNSRGGFVGLVVLGLFLLIAGPHRKVVAACAVAAVLVLLLVAPPTYWNEVRSISTAAEKGDTGETRLYFWGIGWKMFLAHPIVGVGTNNFGIRAPEFQDPYRVAWRSHTWGRVAHSMYFTLLPELGLVGTVLFAAILVWCFRVWRRLRRLGRASPDDPLLRTGALAASGLSAGLIGTLITGTFLSVLYYPVLWILVALLAALDASVDEALARRASEAPDAA
jgi:O-antigen ligase